LSRIDLAAASGRAAVAAVPFNVWKRPVPNNSQKKPEF
jgi:hypothetical protein